MPTSYVEVAEEEMTYLDGGYSIRVNSRMLNKSYCLTLANYYASAAGLSRQRCANEIYSHALMYYVSSSKITWYASCLFGLGTSAVHAVLKWVRSHSNPIDLGNDSSFRVTVFKYIWKYF